MFSCRNELRNRAKRSFDILLSTVDPDLNVATSLFNPGRNSVLSKKRGFMTVAESKETDEVINRFIYRVGGYWQDGNVLNCLEYLVRQFSIER